MTDHQQTEIWIWTEGKAYLAENGCTADQAGRVIGRWRKSHHPVDVQHALKAALRNQPSHPITYVSKILAERKAMLAAPITEKTDSDLLQTIGFLRERVGRIGVGRYGLEAALTEAERRGITENPAVSEGA